MIRSHTHRRLLSPSFGLLPSATPSVERPGQTASAFRVFLFLVRVSSATAPPRYFALNSILRPLA